MTLTQTAILTKQIIAITLATLIVGSISFVSYKVWYAYYLTTLPPVEEKPDTKFGILPYPDFPQSFISSSNFSYSLDTTTGGLPKLGIDPTFDKLIRVYFVIKPYATFLSPEKSQTLAEKFNIDSPPIVINETTYQFQSKNKNLIVNLDSGNFNYTKDASPSGEIRETDEKLISDFKKVLGDLGILKEELRKGRTKITHLSDVSTLISIWPEDLDKKPFFSSAVNKSEVSAVVIGPTGALENYLSLDFSFYQIDKSTFATYPTKLPEEAFNDLRTGKGVIIMEPQNPQVSITSISLGYFIPQNYNPYIQPVYIFEGPQFVAYVPAVSNEFLKER